MVNQNKDNASGSSPSSKTTGPPAPVGNENPSWLKIPAQADGNYNLQSIVDAMAAQYPDQPQPTLEELTAIAHRLGFYNLDGSVNRDAPLPAGQRAVPSVTYDTTGITANRQIIETPVGEDAGFHAIIGSIKAQTPQLEPPTLTEMKEIARELGLGYPYGDFDLAAVLAEWGKKRGLKLGLGVRKKA